MPNPATTKTLGPLHFEDLEPHRFEDLVRDLAYDYRDWQKIEATGRSGSDQGWDIRAFEKASKPDSVHFDSEETEAEERDESLEGNAWMIQVKRERSLGPADVKRIVSEVDGSNPPHGYVLAAPTNFSKKSYDVFRAELRDKGVSEFYLWGRPELEDMLYMPKNDRILFAFFGISLTSRRRSRTTEVRAAITVKNKLYRAIGSGRQLHQEVLIRDLADTHYPDRTQYPDFVTHRRWRLLTATGHHPLGLILDTGRYYAYIDHASKEWDFTAAINLYDVEHDRYDDEDQRRFRERQQAVLEAWEFLPMARQGMCVVQSLLRYTDIATVDDKGDALYAHPHIFVEYGNRGPYAGVWETLETGQQKILLDETYKQIKVFPKSFAVEPPQTPKTRITVDAQTVRDFEDYKDVGVLFAIDKRYKDLKPHDVVTINDVKKFAQAATVQIKYAGQATVSEYLREARDAWKLRTAMTAQIGIDVMDDHVIHYLEYKRYHKRLSETEAPAIIEPEQ
jgi:Restriction endonuclease